MLSRKEKHGNILYFSSSFLHEREQLRFTRELKLNELGAIIEKKIAIRLSIFYCEAKSRLC